MDSNALSLTRCKVKLLSADLPGSLNLITKMGVVVSEISFQSLVECSFYIPQKDYSGLKNALVSRGDAVKILRPGLIERFWKTLLQHRIFFLLLCLFSISVFLLPRYILFVDVEGNQRVSNLQILSCASKYGLSIGAARKDIRSEKIKNGLIAEISELKWAGINTKGCKALIAVEEKLPDTDIENNYPGKVVAALPGEIVSCVAKNGNLLCAPGDFVEQGQTLISGNSDVGRTIVFGKAAGEIFAYTYRPISVSVPSEVNWVDSTRSTRRQFSLIFPKFKIKLYFSSGILGADCGRMYERHYINLPGGFVLPFGIEVETVTLYNLVCSQLSQEEAVDAMLRVSRLAANRDMIAGKLLSEQTIVGCNTDRYDLEGSFSCYEMIGRLQIQEIEDYYEHNRRENG